MSVMEVLQQKLQQQLSCIYNDIELDMSTSALAVQLIDIMRITEYCQVPAPFVNHWSEKDIIMITYADSVLQQGERPLTTLAQFIDSYLSCINAVHI
jgi:sucrose phosphorylase